MVGSHTATLGERVRIARCSVYGVVSSRCVCVCELVKRRKARSKRAGARARGPARCGRRAPVRFMVMLMVLYVRGGFARAPRSSQCVAVRGVHGVWSVVHPHRTGPYVWCVVASHPWCCAGLSPPRAVPGSGRSAVYKSPAHTNQQPRRSEDTVLVYITVYSTRSPVPD